MATFFGGEQLTEVVRLTQSELGQSGGTIIFEYNIPTGFYALWDRLEIGDAFFNATTDLVVEVFYQPTLQYRDNPAPGITLGYEDEFYNTRELILYEGDRLRLKANNNLSRAYYDIRLKLYKMP